MLNQNQALIQAYDSSIISRTERRVAGFNRNTWSSTRHAAE